MATQREMERIRKALEKERADQYRQTRQDLVDQKNSTIESRNSALQTVLETALNATLDLNSVVVRVLGLPSIPAMPMVPPPPPKKEMFEAEVPPAGFLERTLGVGKAKRRNIALSVQQRYQALVDDYELHRQMYNEGVRQRNLVIETRQQAINAFQARLQAKDAEMVEKYFAEALRAVPYPLGFNCGVNTIRYTPSTGELKVEFELPTYESVIPKSKGFKYVKSRDEIEELKFTATDERRMGALYEDMIAAIPLRVMHQLILADTSHLITSILFNGVVNAVDKATGQSIRPCLVSVQVSRDEFEKLDLARVDKRACLKHLKALTSPSSKELVPVKPIANIVTTDPRFIAEVDVLSGLDSRTNLLEIDPFEFEHLICNLFAQMGLESSTTRASRDGGVDVVAFNTDPILGGKVIIQAKRYRNTVEVSAVRDLYGSVMNEGATKGILVTTSGYGPESRNFAKDKPLQLIDGNELLFLLQKHGYEAKIEIPK